MRGFQFLSAKPLIIVVNYSESDISREKEVLAPLQEYQEKPNVAVTGLSAKVEMEISQLEEEDRTIFLEELGIEEPASYKLIHKSYELLGLISFFTVGFIRAEVVNYADFIQLGSMAKCREKGLLRLEGKNYIVRDGDIMTIRFNV